MTPPQSKFKFKIQFQMFVTWPYLVVLLKELGPVCLVVFDLANDFDVLAVIHDDPVNVRLG